MSMVKRLLYIFGITSDTCEVCGDPAMRRPFGRKHKRMYECGPCSDDAFREWQEAERAASPPGPSPILRAPTSQDVIKARARVSSRAATRELVEQYSIDALELAKATAERKAAEQRPNDLRGGHRASRAVDPSTVTPPSSPSGVRSASDPRRDLSALNDRLRASARPGGIGRGDPR